MRIVALVILLAGAILILRGPADSRARRAPPVVEPPVPAEAVKPRIAAPPPEDRLARIYELMHATDRSAVPELERQLSPRDPHIAAAALLAIDACGGDAWTPCDRLLRSPDLEDADPLFFVAGRVRQRPIQLAVAELDRDPYPETLRRQARAWLIEWRTHQGAHPCGAPLEGGTP